MQRVIIDDFGPGRGAHDRRLAPTSLLLRHRLIALRPDA
jgi:hypothetical protein